MGNLFARRFNENTLCDPRPEADIQRHIQENIYRVPGHPEWILKEIEGWAPPEQGQAGQARQVQQEIANAIFAAQQGVGPRVIAHRFCGVQRRTARTRRGEQFSYDAVLGVLVSERVIGDGRKITNAEYDVMMQRVRAAGFRKVDDNNSNFMWGHTASHPQPQWWFIDYGHSFLA